VRREVTGMRMPGGHPHIAARVKFHGMRDLTFRCLECGGEACPPWTTYCPLCAAERDAILSVDDEGFACELDGRRIVDEGHWLVDFCRHHEWQCFVVSRDPYNNSVRGLRRTCEEENDNSNKAWSRTRRRVTGVPAEKAWGKTAVECVEMLRSSLFHVWETVQGRFESDYYVDLGIICPDWQTTRYEDIAPRFYIIETDTFEAVKKKLELLRTRDPAGLCAYNFIYGDDLCWLRAAGKERSSDFGSLRDHGTVSLMALTPRENKSFLHKFDELIALLGA